MKDPINADLEREGEVHSPEGNKTQSIKSASPEAMDKIELRVWSPEMKYVIITDTEL